MEMHPEQLAGEGPATQHHTSNEAMQQPPMPIHDHVPMEGTQLDAPDNALYQQPPPPQQHASGDAMQLHATGDAMQHHAPAEIVQHHAPAEIMQHHAPAEIMHHHAPAQDMHHHAPAQDMHHHAPAQDMHHHAPAQDMPQPMANASHDSHKHMDQTMDVDDSMNTTITASTVAPIPDFNANNNAYAQHNNSFTPEPHRPSTSYSDTAYQYTNHNGSRFNTSSDADTPPRHAYYDASKETHMGQSHSRPNSQMGRYPASEGNPRANSYQDQNQRSAQQQQQQQTPPEPASKNASVVIKVGMVGDAQIGKTSLMVKYVEGSWDEDYIQTLGVNFMEKTISIRNTEITFSIWDLGGQREFVNMLPLVCNDAVAILFMFDLTRKSTLNSIKEWYRQGRGFNKTAIPFLVGTKYDHFVNFPREEQEEISNQAKRFARAMKASLIFSSTSHSINVQKIFKIVLSKAFDLKCTIPEIENIGEPLLLYQAV
ncbi:P-loop containing nucleoside triphosphate hydrolase protein [Ampelomyces quisqualis]|uniref:P-loop containing nucleoside triphosphate hydrolase protein n=1 Tax=Ampelomyces quisqualis TaxID=50730 RepID=A0A6A5R1D8_AMPQU|nr:P-loop containing nucleoside triphosphate hydrolase protein [Ampelomyces quisqualis]